MAIGSSKHRYEKNCTDMPTKGGVCDGKSTSDTPLISAFVWDNQTINCREIVYHGCKKTKNYFNTQKHCLESCYMPALVGQNAEFFPVGTHGPYDPLEGTMGPDGIPVPPGGAGGEDGMGMGEGEGMGEGGPGGIYQGPDQWGDKDGRPKSGT